MKYPGVLRAYNLHRLSDKSYRETGVGCDIVFVQGKPGESFQRSDPEGRTDLGAGFWDEVISYLVDLPIRLILLRNEGQNELTFSG